MNFKLLSKLVSDKLKDRGTYILALIVGTLINAYGQLLVPWFRNGLNPFEELADELQRNTGLTVFSIFLAYAFPFFVGTYSAVTTRYKNRRIESIADFPERKPDPVFRVSRDGKMVEVGAETQRMFERHGIETAQCILGDAVWDKVQADHQGDNRYTVRFDKENTDYLVTYTPTNEDQINIYMTRLPD